MTSERRELPSSPNEMVEAWIRAATDAERRWNEFFVQLMGTERFAEQLRLASEQSRAAQEAFARQLEPQLRALGLPTQADLARLSERVTELERRLDRLTDPDAAPPPPAARPRRRASGSRRTAPPDGAASGS